MIARRKPIARKRAGPPRKGRLLDPQYLEWIRNQQCACCGSSSEAAHVGLRGLGQKSSDHETIPLCPYHHTSGRVSVHRLGAHFWDFWDLDRDALIAKYRALYLAEFPERAK